MVHFPIRVALLSCVCLFALMDEQTPVQLGLITKADVSHEGSGDVGNTFLVEVIPNPFDWERNRTSHFSSLNPGHLQLTDLSLMHDQILI